MVWRNGSIRFHALEQTSMEPATKARRSNSQQTPTAKGNSKLSRISASSKWLRQERPQAGKTHTETTARSALWLPRNIKFVASFHHRWNHQCSQGNKGRECWGTRWDLPRHVEEHRASCDPIAAGFLRWCGDNSKDSTNMEVSKCDSDAETGKASRWSH